MSTEDVTKKLYHHHGVTGDKNAGTDALTNSLVAIGAKQHRASQQAQDNDANAPKKPLLGSIATLRNSQAGLGGSQRRLLLQTSSVVSISQDKVELTERQGSEKQLGAGATQEADGETSVWMVDLHDFISNLLTGLVKPHRNFVPSAEPQLDDFKHEEIKVWLGFCSLFVLSVLVGLTPLCRTACRTIRGVGAIFQRQHIKDPQSHRVATHHEERSGECVVGIACLIPPPQQANVVRRADLHGVHRGRNAIRRIFAALLGHPRVRVFQSPQRCDRRPSGCCRRPNHGAAARSQHLDGHVIPVAA